MKTITIKTDNTKLVVETEARTIGEICDILTQKGISLDNMTLFEGLTKQEFNIAFRDAELPTNVMYKGQPTDNLVFMLTRNKKKLNSGNERQDLYAVIFADEALKAAIKAKFGRNYTNVSTADLGAFVSLWEDDTDEECQDNCPTCANNPFIHTIMYWVNTGMLDAQTIVNALDVCNTCTKKGVVAMPYTDNEIDEILNQH